MGAPPPPPPDRLQDEDRMELPEIRLKYLNPSSLCLSCSHQEPWPPPAAAAAAAAVAAAMWEELSTNKGCPRPAEAESPSPRPHAPSRLHTWGREDDYHQPAVLQRPDGHLSPAVHCRFVTTLSLSLRLSKPLVSIIPPLFREEFECGLLLYILEALSDTWIRTKLKKIYTWKNVTLSRLSV